MKSSTARQTKKTETPRLITNEELEELTLHIYLYDEGWVVAESDYTVRSVHPTQAEAILKGRTMAKNRSGRLIIHTRNGRTRKWEAYWSGPVRFEPLKPSRPSSPPINATRK